jgi:BASS family bile acid:Na+ symporter
MEASSAISAGGQQIVLSLILGIMIFGLALDIHPREFAGVFKKPKAPIAGLTAQFLLLPAATLIVTLMVDLDPAIELGMILVACCPGGAISNFITLLAKGNVALSLSITALASLLAIVLLPLNFSFWSSFNPQTAAYLHAVNVDAKSIFYMLVFVLAIPLFLGQLTRHFLPAGANFIHKILKPISVIMLFGFIIIAVGQNIETFLSKFWMLFTIVVLHNALAFFLGFIAARIGKLNGPDTRAVSIEVGLQNSSLAIAIIYAQFSADSNMLLIAAFWGTWHIVAGLLFAAGSQYLLTQKDAKCA